MANGADGVLISGCHPGDCHYMSGNYVARRKFALTDSLLKHLGMEEGRISFSWVSAAEGGRFAEVVKGVTDRVTALGPNYGLFKVADGGGTDE